MRSPIAVTGRDVDGNSHDLMNLHVITVNILEIAPSNATCVNEPSQEVII